MAKFTHVLIMLIIAVIYAGFSYSVGTVFSPEANYEDFCRYDTAPRMPMVKEAVDCPLIDYPSETCEGYWDVAAYDQNACPSAYTCNTCQKMYDTANEDRSLYMLIILSILGVAAIVVGLTYRTKNTMVEWILNGFLLGGLATIFIATVAYLGDVPRFIRPFILIVELGIVIAVAVKKASK